MAPGKRRKRNNKGQLFDAQAIDLARSALEELDEGEVGVHTGVSVLGDNVVIHHFEAHVPGYRGWEWTAVLACADGSHYVTVNELALMPGRDALRAPSWIPYEDRVRPGDLKPGDQFPPRADDDRLDTLPDGTHTLTKKGFEDSLARWRENYGPTTEYAEKAHLKCSSCAFFHPIADFRTFGACLNIYAADGRVVHVAYGCGAHSETPPADNLAAKEHEAFDDGHL
ncbi:DUF3027 domain-containing protein [Corynebacterium epidermidicanis]|uniref:Putative DUF3027 family protein n=1 Tax=Corynebacterium epidermidicanis TaxID=1050174 RepID=A0A0G3GPU1_9CORY|nr:DUF3027 domain-containing protein [Corynebacterium epidermidicanis]AKK02605.1 putative DUF3027 family protein [Corynebacterium epidermidicanis]